MTQDAQGRWRHKGRFVRVTTTTLRPGRKGANARGICAHKATKGAKAAKKQNRPQGGPRDVTAYRMRLDKARGRLA